jgi:hypothetical protein
VPLSYPTLRAFLFVASGSISQDWFFASFSHITAGVASAASGWLTHKDIKEAIACANQINPRFHHHFSNLFLSVSQPGACLALSGISSQEKVIYSHFDQAIAEFHNFFPYLPFMNVTLFFFFILNAF